MSPLSLRSALSERVVVADGAMGTMLQGFDLELSDFDNHDGCNEILNVTRPDVVRKIHDAYLEVGADCITTNTFGANLSNLSEYQIEDRIGELAEAGARIAREAADSFSTPDKPRWVLGSIGPGTKLPTLGHVPFAVLRDTYQECAAGLLRGGVDALLIETAQDLLGAKASIIGAKRAIKDSGRDVVLIANVTIETTGTMLLGTEIGAALTALEPLGIDLIGLNCATGPAEMTEHLRYLSQHAGIGLSCMPNAGLPVLTSDGAHYPLTAAQLAEAHLDFVKDYKLNLVGGCCGTTPEHIAQVVAAVGGAKPEPREPKHEPGISSLYSTVPFDQQTAYLAIGERTNANGSKAFREALLAGETDELVEIARSQTKEGAHLLDVCVDYVGRDGVTDMSTFAALLATSSTLPIVLDSTEPAVLQAGLERLGGRSIVNSVNYEDGDGPNSRIAKIMPLVREHGAAVMALTIDEEGQARTAADKVRIAKRLITDLTTNWGVALPDILIDCLTFPICTGQEETRRDGLETISAIAQIKKLYPEVNTTLGVSNISFGVNPAARIVLNSVFLHECIAAGLDSAIVHSAKIVPLARIDEEQLKVTLDLIYDRRSEGYDPLVKFLELFADVKMADTKADRAAELAAMPLGERLRARIIDGEPKGIEDDLTAALKEMSALDIINLELLEGMKTVGELFGSGQMQLPFVLQSAEVMKTAVAFLEPFMEKSDHEGKGTIVLATVKGDVHDIGKNLVDIILTNNGYNVVNLGIKQPVSAIIEAAEASNADVIGMSGLLVKSTVIMKENLEDLNARGLAAKWPVLLGGAALTRAYVEEDLSQIYEGEVRYARDAFEGLQLMDALIRVKRGVPGASLPPLKGRRAPAGAPQPKAAVEVPARSNVSTTIAVPEPPFWGSRIVKGIPLADFASWLDERATFLGQWGLKPTRGDGPSYAELVATEGLPRLRYWLSEIQTQKIMTPAVVYGYWPANGDGDDIVVFDPQDHDKEILRWHFPRQNRDEFLCLADYLRPLSSGVRDVLPVQLVTMGSNVAAVTNKLFEANAYRDYLELHGLSVQLTEALAEFWHARVRSELKIAGDDPTDLSEILRQRYRGERFSFGYPACPDLESRRGVIQLLEPERIGVTLSEELQLHPEQSTDALIFHHPEARYFNAK